VSQVSLTRLQVEGVFSELAALFPTEGEVHALLVDLGADRVLDLPRLPTVGNMPFAVYWRKVCERIDNGMFERFGLAELVTEALNRNPRNRVMLKVISGEQSNDYVELPRELDVLCLLAGPDTLSRLRLRKEHAIILDASRQRGPRRLTVTANPATRIGDIIREVLAAKPSIVHFAGHGTKDGRIVFEQDNGDEAPVLVGALASVFDILPAPLSCLVLGSCFGAMYSGELLGSARSVAGSLTALDDAAALEFSRGFYTAICAGVGSPAEAFDAGLAQMRLCGHDTAGMRLKRADHPNRDGAR
jgi:hypothetical protein